MIKLQIVGNLGKDCTVNEVSGRKVINFSVAHTDKFKDASGNIREKTYWVECAYWTDRTAIAQYLLKGKMVYAEGTPEADGYLNREGQAAATLRMRVRDIQLLGGGNSSDYNNPSNTALERTPAVAASVSDKPVSHPTTSLNTDVESSAASDDLPF